MLDVPYGSTRGERSVLCEQQQVKQVRDVILRFHFQAIAESHERACPLAQQGVTINSDLFEFIVEEMKYSYCSLCVSLPRYLFHRY